MEYTGINLQTLQDRELILLLLLNKRGGISPVLGGTHVKSAEKKPILSIYATKVYGGAVSESAPDHKIKLDKNVREEDLLNTHDDSKIGYFIVWDLYYPDNMKEKTKFFPFCPENKTSLQDKFSDYMNNMKITLKIKS